MVICELCEMLWNIDVDHSESFVNSPLQILLYRISLCTESVSVELVREKSNAPATCYGVEVLEFSDPFRQ